MEELKKPLSVEVFEKRIGMLKWNFEELNRELDLRLERYHNLQYTEEQIAEAKKDRAGLNAFKKAMNDRKIELKKEFCEPYDDFASQVKQLIAKIDKASAGIDLQIKAYEEKEKAEKRAELERYWTEHGPRQINVKLDRVFDEKWLNKSCRPSQWQTALGEIAEKIDSDVLAIAHFEDVDKMNFCITEYQKTVDLGRTLAAWEDKQEADRQAAETRERMMREREEREARRKAESEAMRQILDAPMPELYTRAFKVQGTREQIIALGNFMKSENIKFWKIQLEEE